MGSRGRSRQVDNPGLHKTAWKEHFSTDRRWHNAGTTVADSFSNLDGVEYDVKLPEAGRSWLWRWTALERIGDYRRVYVGLTVWKRKQAMVICEMQAGIGFQRKSRSNTEVPDVLSVTSFAWSLSIAMYWYRFFEKRQRSQNRKDLVEIPEEHLQKADLIWNYMKLGHSLSKADVILVLGNPDLRTAEHASRLWLEGYGDWLMFSGKVGSLTQGKWMKTESEVFRDVAVKMGIPLDRIILENGATNTGENITMSYEALKERNVPVTKLILIQMPHMERRTYATFMQQWPPGTGGIEVALTSPDIPLRQYPNEDVGSIADVISVMLGCMHRIKHYPEKGYQIPQEIPRDVWNSYIWLSETGLYSNHLS
ncbi:hypothetical protein ScPMuIL_001896 [Solemya velum]